VSMDNWRMVSPMNADLCSSKPFTISLKGQFANSLLFFVIKWFWVLSFWPTISNECTGVCCQEILFSLFQWCNHRKDWILPAPSNNSKTTGFFQLYNHYSSQEQSFSSTVSRLFASVSASISIQSYARPPTVI
jgi:hypothetical protein